MIDNFRIWKPDDWQKYNGFEVDLERCRYSVFDIWSSYQCSFKRKVDIDGYGFCRRHAKIIGRDQ